MARIRIRIFILLLFSVLALAFSDGAQFVRQPASSLAEVRHGEYDLDDFSTSR